MTSHIVVGWLVGRGGLAANLTHATPSKCKPGADHMHAKPMHVNIAGAILTVPTGGRPPRSAVEPRPAGGGQVPAQPAAAPPGWPPPVRHRRAPSPCSWMSTRCAEISNIAVIRPVAGLPGWPPRARHRRAPSPCNRTTKQLMAARVLRHACKPPATTCLPVAKPTKHRRFTRT